MLDRNLSDLGETREIEKKKEKERERENERIECTANDKIMT